MRAKFKTVVSVGLLSAMVIVSCGKRSLGVAPPSYAFSSEADHLLSELTTLSEEDGSKGGGEGFSFDRIEKLKSESIKEIYINISFSGKFNKNNKINLTPDDAVLALIYDQQGKAEVWQVWPIACRISCYADLREAGSSLRPPYPFSSASTNHPNN